MGKATDRLRSRYHFQFCIRGRSFKLISFTFVCERETLGAVHSTQLWVLVKYHLFLINVRSFTKSKFKYNYKLTTLLYLILLIIKLFQRFQNFIFKNVSLCLRKHICRSLTECLTLNSVKLALNSCIMPFNCRGKA